MSTNSVPVTLEEIEVSLNCTNELIDTMVKKKYAQDDTEKTYDDVIGRICRILTNRFGTTFAGIPVQDVLSILTDGYFIPGGSILAGLTDNNLGDKKSLSNCYALGIKNDSIEAICDCIKYACRTYSYRGGVGIDLTVLRPNGTKVNNAARTSSGAVSFMPMISQANATIGTNGRRAAMMMTMDIRHPDIFEFLWCKADPEGVFHRDHMAKDVTARYLKAYLSSSKDDIPEGIHDCLLKLADNGRLPDISTANISIKVSNEFMDLASDETYDKPWVTCFPDIDKDKELYDTKWNGNYDDWEACGGTLIHDYSHSAFITTRNYKRFIGRTLYVDRSAPLTEESILKLIEDNGGSAKVTLINPSPRQLLRELAEANHMRNDPGLLFWDKHTEWSLQSHLSPDLRPVTTNPCGEISGPVYFACNLGAHILHRYVRNPYMGDSYFDARLFYENCEKAMVLMNMFSLINEDMHPLQEQRDMEIYSRRIGIEFTGLGDMISMMGMKYGSGESIEFVSNLMHSRSQVELLTNIYLAKELGPCTAADPEVNSPGLTRVMVSDFYKKVVSQGNWDYFNNINRYSSTVESDPAAYKYPIHFTPRIDSFSDILKYGLRNSATSTVGPTGTLSIVSGYCSSGIEPVFDIFMDRKTRVGDVPSYQICHKALFDHVYAHMSEKNISAVSIEDIKSRYDVVVASELNYHARIAMQAGIQMTCDSSISSTINLPEDTTVDTLMDIYMEAYKKGLKGVTTYRDGSMDSVMSSSKAPTAKPNDAPVESNDDITYAYNDKGLPYTDAKDDIRPIIPTVSPSLARGVVMELPDVLDAKRHEVVWEGHKVYLIVPLDDNGFPVEIFVASLPFSVATDTHGTFSPNDYMHKLEMWNAITRLASIDLRAGVAPEVVVTQLQRSSASVCSLISIIARVLSLYAHGAPSAKSAYQHTDGEMQSHEVDSSKLAICPECGNKSLVYGGGCNQCISPECGYSKCM